MKPVASCMLAIAAMWLGASDASAVANATPRTTAIAVSVDRDLTVREHSTANEVYDGVAIHVDAAAVLAHVKIRRDVQAPWPELDTPLTDLAGAQVLVGADHGGYAIRLGELGCNQNYSMPLLRAGVMSTST